MAVTMAEITKLRHLTSAGLMDCKKALAETDGDIEKAVEILRKKGQAVAAKREDRTAAEGCVLAKNEGDFAAVIALNCETDFVAKNEGFVNLTRQLLDLAVAHRCKSLDELKALTVDGRTVADLVTEESGKTGEKTTSPYPGLEICPRTILGVVKIPGISDFVQRKPRLGCKIFANSEILQHFALRRPLRCPPKGVML